MSALPEGYSIRPATKDDVDAVAEALAAEDLTATGAVFYDADFVRLVWSTIDLPNDTWVIEALGGRVIGHANVGREGEDVVEAWGVVHREHHGLGTVRCCSSWSRAGARNYSRRAAGFSSP